MKDLVTNIFCAAIGGAIVILCEPIIVKVRKGICNKWYYIKSIREINEEEFLELINCGKRDTGVKHYDNIANSRANGEYDTSNGIHITADISKALSITSPKDKRKLYKLYLHKDEF